MTAEELAAALGLKPHPEGGYYKETYRSAESFVPSGSDAPRSVSTAILFLLPEGEKSHFHRIKSDELWHHHLGGALELIQISPEGKAESVIIGSDLASGQKLQHAVPAGYWFGSRPLKGAGFCLVGCTVAPGFDFKDFELAKRKKLVELFPLHREVIVALTPEYGCF